MADLLVIPDFLDAAAREALVAELERAGGNPATVTGAAAEGAVDPHVRKATRIDVAPETRERVRRHLLDRKGAVEAHFGVPLADCEPPQFLRYTTGDFFVAHQDGNTPLVHDDTRFRRVSAVIFLSPQAEAPAPGTYGGGALVFHGRYDEPPRRDPAPAEPGTLVAFRAETTHEVLPVTHGERYTVVAWYR
jgi:SM-20-related protein